MAPSLRKRLSKRAPEATASKTNDSDHATSPLTNAMEHLHIASTNDLTSTPPPPEHLTLPREPDKARCSPSKSLLERYKNRAPAALSSSLSVTGEKSSRSRNKNTRFTEDLNSDKRPLLQPDSEIGIAVPEPVKSKPTVRKVGGVNFEMLNTGGSEQPRSRSADPPRARSLTVDDDDAHSRRRSTRSESRRRERSDSMVADEAEAINNASKTKDAESEVAKSDNESPRRRSTLRKQKKKDLLSRPKIPRTLRSSTSTSTPTRTSTKSRDRHDNNNNNSTTPIPSASDESLDDNASTRALISPSKKPLERRHLRPDIAPIKVLPPFPNDMQLPGLLWASPLSANSRPDSPWTWCKRWTCCRCDGLTIVEQGVCSRLACGHVRCGDRCKAVRDCKLFQ